MSNKTPSPFIIALIIFFTRSSFSLSIKLSKCVSRLFIRFSFACSA
ncbi:secreted protein [Candidatus Omnitrophus magneticus]|uniref:Secreted protein n=1 Tax=Candidatus Omnitrophus magneticus TaxID=1609969 RepID=A0A0F0CSX3_9BACT|nr:secreted protein [Candidatus Omnitrophus magneticus]